MGPATRIRYQDSFDDFEQYCKATGLEFDTVAAADSSLEKYFEVLFLGEESIEAARYTLYGLAWVQCWTTKGGAFPRARQCLKGWAREEPARSRQPCPWEIAILMASDLAGRSLEQTLAAAAVLLIFDGYFRPGEALRLTGPCVIPPHGHGVVGQWAIQVAPSGSGRPIKTGVYDDTVIMGEAKTERQWLIPVVNELFKRAGDGALFPGLTLAALERHMRGACQRRCQGEIFTPHQLRHGGPSHDALYEHKSIKQIQARGMWKARESVRCYEKHGTLLRTRRLFPQRMLVEASHMAKTLGADIVRELRRWPSAASAATSSKQPSTEPARKRARR